MTKLTTLLFVLGMSSIAAARPAQLPASTGWRDRQELQLDREQAQGHRTFRPTWVALSAPTKIVRGRDVIQVGAQQGRFAQLRFQTTAGSSSIDRVLIRFADGRWQVTDVGTRLSPDQPMVEVRLDGDRRKIDQIIVLGSSNRRASYQVFGI